MADTNVGAGVLFHISEIDVNNFSIADLNDASIEFAAENVDSETIAIKLGFTISRAYLTNEDIILQRDNTNDLAHFPFDIGKPGIIAIHNLKVLLSQGNSTQGVILTVSAELPGSKVGGAPVKVGGAPVKVGGAGL